MYLFDATILGAIQGVTEFLPISSTGHVEMFTKLFDLHDFGKNFNIITNLGTLSAILLYFRRDFTKLFLGGIDFLCNKKTIRRSFFLMMLLGNLPTIIIFGILECLGLTPHGSELMFGINLIVFGLILYACDRNESQNKDFSLPDAMKVGLAQLLSIFTGVSRLGICMSACRFLKYSRQESFRFCMLFSIIPASGACAFKLLKMLKNPDIISFSSTDAFVGIITAFLFGFISLHTVYKFLKSHTFLPIVVYRLVSGSFVLWRIFSSSN